MRNMKDGKLRSNIIDANIEIEANVSFANFHLTHTIDSDFLNIDEVISTFSISIEILVYSLDGSWHIDVTNDTDDYSSNILALIDPVCEEVQYELGAYVGNKASEVGEKEVKQLAIDVMLQLFGDE